MTFERRSVSGKANHAFLCVSQISTNELTEIKGSQVYPLYIRSNVWPLLLTREHGILFMSTKSKALVTSLEQLDASFQGKFGGVAKK